MIKNKFKNYALILIFTAIFTLGSTLPVGIVSAFFSAIVISLLGYSVIKYHYYFVGLVSACILAFYTAFTKDLSSGLSLGIETILYGLTLGIGYNMKLSEFKTVGLITFIYTLFVVINVKFSGIGDNLRQNLAFSMESVYSLYQGQISQTDFKTLISTLLDVFVRFLPSFIIISGICFGMWNFWIFKKLLKIAKTDTSTYINFRDLHADKSISISYLIISFIGFITPGGSYLGDALANVISVASFVFFIFGLSYVDFVLTLKMKNNLLKRIILIGLIFSSLPLVGIPFVLLSVLGAMDGCFNYRNKFNK